MDLAVFNGKIYVLTDRAGIGIFKLWPNPTLMLLDVKGTPIVSTMNLQLVILNEELLMLDKMHPECWTYKLDLTNMEWVRVERLGNAALFVHKNQIAIISNPSKWGGATVAPYITWMVSAVKKSPGLNIGLPFCTFLIRAKTKIFFRMTYQVLIDAGRDLYT